MQTEVLVLNQSCKWKIVKELSEALPDIGVAVLASTLVIEPIDLSDLPRLVVASEDSDSLLVSDFKRKKESDSLDRVMAPVHVVTHEEVVSFGNLAPDLEELDEVVKLAVDVPTDNDRGSDWLHIGFLSKYLHSLGTQSDYIALSQWSAILQFLYKGVHLLDFHQNN